MKFRMLLSALLLAVGLVSVARGEEAKRSDTPTEVLIKFNKGINELDFASIARLCDGTMKTEIEKTAKQFAELKAAVDRGDAKAKQAYERLKDYFAKFKVEVKSEKIEGDFAVLDAVMSNPAKSRAEKVHLKKVNGEWKLIDESDCRK